MMMMGATPRSYSAIAWSSRALSTGRGPAVVLGRAQHDDGVGLPRLVAAAPQVDGGDAERPARRPGPAPASPARARCARAAGARRARPGAPLAGAAARRRARRGAGDRLVAVCEWACVAGQARCSSRSRSRDGSQVQAQELVRRVRARLHAGPPPPRSARGRCCPPACPARASASQAGSSHPSAAMASAAISCTSTSSSRSPAAWCSCSAPSSPRPASTSASPKSPRSHESARRARQRLLQRVQPLVRARRPAVGDPQLRVHGAVLRAPGRAPPPAPRWPRRTAPRAPGTRRTTARAKGKSGAVSAARRRARSASGSSSAASPLPAAARMNGSLGSMASARRKQLVRLALLAHALRGEPGPREQQRVLALLLQRLGQQGVRVVPAARPRPATARCATTSSMRPRSALVRRRPARPRSSAPPFLDRRSYPPRVSPRPWNRAPPRRPSQGALRRAADLRLIRSPGIRTYAGARRRILSAPLHPLRAESAGGTLRRGYDWLTTSTSNTSTEFAGIGPLAWVP